MLYLLIERGSRLVRGAGVVYGVTILKAVFKDSTIVLTCPVYIAMLKNETPRSNSKAPNILFSGISMLDLISHPKCFLRAFSICSFGMQPTTLSTSFPSFMINIVGIL